MEETVEDRVDVKCNGGVEEEVKSKQNVVGVAENGRGLENDPELDQLLDSSLSEFGKHIPPSHDDDEDPKPKLTAPDITSSFGPEMLGDTDPMNDPMMKELEDMFGEEFAKQAEAQLSEALEMLQSENPELLKQFEDLAQSVGNQGDRDVSNNLGSSVDSSSNQTSGDPNTGLNPSLEEALEDTVRRLQESTQDVQEDPIGGLPSNLLDMMGKLNLGAGEGGGEEQMMKMMEGMMSTLLSKEVLYPSLMDLCKQYPEWLDSHSDSISSEDRSRYTRQLDIMKAICHQFEEEGEGTDKQEKILQLMQELQECGQPPDDLGGTPLSQMGLPPNSSSQTPDQCIVM